MQLPPTAFFDAVSGHTCTSGTRKTKFHQKSKKFVVRPAGSAGSASSESSAIFRLGRFGRFCEFGRFGKFGNYNAIIIL